MAYRKIRKCPMLIAAALLGSVVAAAPAQAAVSQSHVIGAAAHCFWSHESGHWDWVNGRRVWVPARSVWVCR